MLLRRLISCLIILSCATLQAASFEVAVSDQAPPTELPSTLSGVLSTESVKIQTEKGVLFEFWLARDLLTGGINAGAMGIGLGELKEGGFLGILRVGREWMDYKNKPVRPGLYTLRYGLQPVDGNHIGVSAYRDFGLLLPIAEDQDPAVAIEYADLIKRAALASGTPHPSVIGMFPLDEEVSAPTVTENEEGQPTLAMQVGDLGFGFVLEGHGEIEGY